MTSARPPATAPRSRWFKLVWIVPVAIVVLAAIVLFAQWLRGTPPLQDFLRDYPGETHLPEGAPVGLPAWLGWQHFLNSLLIVMIIRTGWQVRTTKKPAAYWTRKNTGVLRTKNPPKKISLDLWLHLSFDVLFVLNGLVFYVLLFSTGQWMRVVPTSWEVIPNALSAALQYVSLNWPTENGWVNYNSLQVLSYFAVIFLAAPLAIITGLRMSGAWPQGTTRLNKVYKIEYARAIHLPVMFFFVAFIIVHVTLVLTTGALRNLNHMYAARDEVSWVGFGLFVGSLAIIAAIWIAARPIILRPIAALTGKVGR